MKFGELLMEIAIKATGVEKVKDAEQATAKLTKVVEKFAKGQVGLSDVLKNVAKGFKGGKMAVAGFATATIGAIVAIDKLGYRLAQTQQRFISFQRQTGLSISTLNKYASASASVSLSATPEGTASSLQRVAQNLFDIRMGRGDVSPYQELGFFGGRSINPYGKSVEQVIEELRVALKGVSDIQATNIITRMGFNAEDLLMLRMSREEFEKINNLYLSSEKQEQLNKMGLRMRYMKDTMKLWGQEIKLFFLPAVVALESSIFNTLKPLVEWLGQLAGGEGGKKGVFWTLAIGLNLLAWRLGPVVGGLTTLATVLDYLLGLSEDFFYKNNPDASVKDFGKWFASENVHIPFVPTPIKKDLMQKAFNITINTSQPPSMVIKDVELHYGNMAGQLTPKAI